MPANSKCTIISYAMCFFFFCCCCCCYIERSAERAGETYQFSECTGKLRSTIQSLSAFFVFSSFSMGISCSSASQNDNTGSIPPWFPIYSLFLCFLLCGVPVTHPRRKWLGSNRNTNHGRNIDNWLCTCKRCFPLFFSLSLCVSLLLLHSCFSESVR